MSNSCMTVFNEILGGEYYVRIGSTECRNKLVVLIFSIVVIFGGFYIMRPQKKEQKRIQEMM